MEIKVYGSGCANCKKLHALVLQAVAELSVKADTFYVTEIGEIMKAGIMRTPGLIMNGKVKSLGRVPSLKEIKQMIQDEQ